MNYKKLNRRLFAALSALVSGATMPYDNAEQDRAFKMLAVLNAIISDLRIGSHAYTTLSDVRQQAVNVQARAITGPVGNNDDVLGMLAITDAIAILKPHALPGLPNDEVYAAIAQLLTSAGALLSAQLSAEGDEECGLPSYRAELDDARFCAEQTIKIIDKVLAEAPPAEPEIKVNGEVLTDEFVDRLVAEAEAGYEIGQIRARHIRVQANDQDHRGKSE